MSEIIHRHPHPSHKPFSARRLGRQGSPVERRREGPIGRKAPCSDGSSTGTGMAHIVAQETNLVRESAGRMFWDVSLRLAFNAELSLSVLRHSPSRSSS
jgi:hypothetical protein